MPASLSDTRLRRGLRARAVRGALPGGVNSPVRAMRAIGRDPVFVDRGEGAELVDVDGNRYVDWVCSWGPLIHGHAHPQILQAIARGRRHGTTFGAPTVAEVELAEEIARRMPRRRDGPHDLERHRGHDERDPPRARRHRPRQAAQVRRRLPRPRRRPARRGRQRPRHRGAARSPGVPAAATADTVIVPWNDATRVAAACAEHEFAAILAEPYPANMGLVPARRRFLEHLRDAGRRPTARCSSSTRSSPASASRAAARRSSAGSTPTWSSWARSSAAGCPPRPTAAARLMERDRPGRRRLPGRHAEREPARGRGRPGDARAARRRPPTRGSPRRPSALADGLRDGRGLRGRCRSVQRAGLVTVFFRRDPCATTRTRAPATSRPTAPGAAGCSRAASTRPPRSSRRGSRRSPTRPEHVDRTVEAAAAAFAELA